MKDYLYFKYTPERADKCAYNYKGATFILYNIDNGLFFVFGLSESVVLYNADKGSDAFLILKGIDS